MLDGIYRFTWDWGSNKKPGWRTSNNLVALMDESV